MTEQDKPTSTRRFFAEIEGTVAQTGEGRGRYYGHPAENHGTTAEMWSSYLSRKLGHPIRLDARDVCMLNAAQKISRDANRPKRDNLIDLAGYAENADRIAERDRELGQVSDRYAQPDAFTPQVPAHMAECDQ